ncbi:CDP-diacylglycerol--serine O-phosphatidyltransferase [Terriglobus tenax]|uniref:CDP-diacylglycerol--serine O-phosphatidyltransferase n=1 Tax=Terriglobus tenax TaxID=1111115 RepID=UPI0021E0C25E|nr:CDP-diacylglycerol--serine O-phosphatidyltransferase [Terriglobus tenax]
MAEVIERRRKQPRRAMYVLPSLFTAGNIAVGFYAILQSMQAVTTGDHNYFDRAALAIAFAMPFDALDGRIARMTNTASEFGKELDSLADVITFGVAPAILAYLWGFRMLPELGNLVFRQKVMDLGMFICFLFLICGASRLARFNITKDPQPQNPGRPDRKYFVGMPIPAAAGVVVSVVHCFNGSPVDNIWVALLWLTFVSFVGFLMVSRWRFWSGKEINLSHGRPFRLLILLTLAIVPIYLFHQYVLIALGLGYTVYGLFSRVSYGWMRRRASHAASN